MGEISHVGFAHGKTSRRNICHDLRWRTLDVDGEVFARLQHAGRNHRHQCDHHLCYHRTVTDVANTRLPFEHFWCRSRSDEGVKSRDRAASDGDTDEREHRSGEDQAAPVNEFGQGRHLQHRVN